MSVAAQVPPVMLPPELSVIDEQVARIVLAAALGLFLGLEREWSQKSAGIRTFSLVSLLGAVFAVLDRPLLLAIGGALVIVQGILLASRGLVAQASGEAVTGDIADADDADADGTDDDADTGLSLTTSVSMLVAYGVGILVANGFVLEGVTVAVVSSLLLVLKRELHDLAWGLSREELRSASEFAILVFVVYPLLPPGEVAVDVLGLSVSIEPRVVWLMVAAVAGIGIVNYAVVRGYGGRGIAVTGFFGGLASSTAVVGTMLDHVRQHSGASSYAVAAILLADAAMALRNLLIALAFTFPDVLWDAIIPLGAVIIGAIAVAVVTADWSETVELDLDSPFSLRNALGFGGLFLFVVVAGGLAQASFGTLGFYATAVLTGLVSSAGATTSAVILYRGVPSFGADAAVLSILLATGSSIGVKAALTLASPSREFAIRVAAWSLALLAASGVVAVAVLV